MPISLNGCVQINSAGYNNLHKSTPWASLHVPELNRHSSHREWLRAFDQAKLPANYIVSCLDLHDPAARGTQHTGLSLSVPPSDAPRRSPLHLRAAFGTGAFSAT